ncbi:unnamed protein product, partial [Prorocentrum cordatum]
GRPHKWDLAGAGPRAGGGPSCSRTRRSALGGAPGSGAAPPGALVAPSAGAGSPMSRPQAPAGEIDTVLFVDIDGVLNFVVVERADNAIHFSSTIADHALLCWHSHWHGLEPAVRNRVEVLVSTHRRAQGHGCREYAELASCPRSNLSAVLVGRLAQVIEQAGERCLTVLTSTWRKPEHSARVAGLEEELARHLGRPFQFGARTPLCTEDGSPGTRLKCIGDFLKALCDGGRSGGRLRVLVLEDDFHYSSFGWQCGAKSIRCAEDAERFLTSKIPPHILKNKILAAARVVHTYDEWRTPSGLPVRAGTGLTAARFCEALAFLGGHCEVCAAAAAAAPPRGRTLLEAAKAAPGLPERQPKVSSHPAPACPKLAGGARRREAALADLGCLALVPAVARDLLRRPGAGRAAEGA